MGSWGPLAIPVPFYFIYFDILYFVLSTPIKSTKINQSLGKKKKKKALELTVSVLDVFSKGKKKPKHCKQAKVSDGEPLRLLSLEVEAFLSMKGLRGRCTFRLFGLKGLGITIQYRKSGSVEKAAIVAATSPESTLGWRGRVLQGCTWSLLEVNLKPRHIFCTPEQPLSYLKSLHLKTDACY